jgi:hypothetical protein
MFETVKLAPLFVVAGIGVLSSIYERVVGEKNSGPTLTIAALLGWGVVVFLIVKLTQEVVTVFMQY